MAQAPHASQDPMVQESTRCVHACGVQCTALQPAANDFSGLMRSMTAAVVTRRLTAQDDLLMNVQRLEVCSNGVLDVCRIDLVQQKMSTAT